MSGQTWDGSETAGGGRAPGTSGAERTGRSGRSAADVVDWDAALRLARAGTPAGPRVPGATRRGVV
ncbi:hypothetical protein RWX45_09400, partial [Actinomyces sp. MRS3W]|nr:hypothetical protein [Actinomyces sp. MRS3W]